MISIAQESSVQDESAARPGQGKRQMDAMEPVEFRPVKPESDSVRWIAKSVSVQTALAVGESLSPGESKAGRFRFDRTIRR